ncbi:CPBP family intramembrane glutamic endopeptidase [Pseudoxanthomonas sacheonensis]|uniref:CPBP family intramembrane glutamic endopeptidase n=1 Tax=Pseudoxanthomonas sacheonensis TaxID=443615 RepID=UPI0013CF44EE|nr:CPBP family intramembrane glutamic endopeptidase [Pseudoxanthomonas sacheonensis]
MTPSRPAIAQTLLVASGSLCVLLAPHFGVPMFLYPLLGLGLCAGMLRYQRLGFADIGFRWRALGIVPLLVGGTLGVAYAMANYAAIGPMLARSLGELPDLSSFDFVRAHLSGYLIALALAWVIGGFYEELVFRGFLQAMLLRHLPAWHGRPVVATTLVVLLFAAYHVQLGAFGVANALVFAVFAAAVRQRWSDNLWYVISFHACADMTAFTLMHLGYL